MDKSPLKIVGWTILATFVLALLLVLATRSHMNRSGHDSLIESAGSTFKQIEKDFMEGYRGTPDSTVIDSTAGQ